MRKRVYLILVVLVVGEVLVGVFCRREREPEYGGRRLSDWVEALETPMKPAPFAPPNMTMVMEDDEAAGAIRRIGTNALPFLLRWIRYETPAWKIQLHRVLKDCMFVDQRRIRADQAAVAFRALGPAGERAIPELTRILNDPEALDTSVRAVDVLTGLGNAGMAPLLAGLPYRQRRILLPFVIARIGEMGTNGRAALRTLLDMFNDSDPNGP